MPLTRRVALLGGAVIAMRTLTGAAPAAGLAGERALPLRPDVVADRYDPYGFIAHANGPYEGHGYTNSREAFEFNYERGFRVFETDFVRLGDGTVLAAHNGLEANYGLRKPFREATWSDLAGHRYLGRYTIMRSQDVLGLLRDHPDAYVILDTKYDHFQIFRTFVKQAGGSHALLDRVIPHIQGQLDLDQYRTVWPLRNYLVALYRTQYLGRFDDPEVLAFVQRNRAPGVMMWWRDRDPRLTLAQNSAQQRRFTPTFAQRLQALGAVVAVHSIREASVVARYARLRVSVYSDGPFGTEALLDTLREPVPAPAEPDFPPGVVPA